MSLSEQDQAILLYRVGRCMAASVVRDRLIANRSRSGDLDLQRGSCDPVARGPVPRARRGGARQAPVVRDRQIANRSRSGDLDLQSGMVPGGRRDLPRLDAFGEIDVSEGQALALRFSSETNPANLENLANPAHILKILLLI